MCAGRTAAGGPNAAAIAAGAYPNLPIEIVPASVKLDQQFAGVVSGRYEG